MNNYRFAIDTNGTLTTGLMSYYKLDNDVNDVSVQVRNGSLVGSPTFVAGKVGNGLYTDNSNYMLAPNEILPWGTVSWSISLWSWFTSKINQGTVTRSLQWLPVPAGFELYRAGLFLDIDIYGSGGHAWLRFSHAWQTWYHLVLTGGGGTNNSPVLYINTNATSLPLLGTGEYVENPMLASGVGVDAGGMTDSIVDEYATWDKILSAQEITDLYNAGNGQTMSPMGVATIDRIDINSLKSYRGFDISKIKKINGI
jgi:hypothetical protein